MSSPAVTSRSPGLEPVILLVPKAILSCRRYLVATAEIAHSEFFLWPILKLSRQIKVYGTKAINVLYKIL